MEEIDIVILGSGGAALGASLYLSRGGYNHVMITGPTPGGIITTTDSVENYLGFKSTTGMDLANTMMDHCREYNNLTMINNIATNIQQDGKKFIVQMENGNTVISKVVIVATGSSHKYLNVPGEFEFANKGVSYCYVCDGFLYRNKIVSVVGGGSAALEAAIYLSKIANQVNLIHRRNTFRGEQILVNRMNKIKNIIQYLDCEIDSVLGDEYLTGIMLKNEMKLESDGLFVNIGQIPNSSIVPKDTKMDNGYIITNNNMRSNIPGLYGIGEITSTSARQLVDAVADGCKAALDIMNYLGE